MTTVFDGLSTHEKKKLSRRDLLKRGAGLSLRISGSEMRMYTARTVNNF